MEEKVKEIVLEANNFSSFNPVQGLAIKKGLLKGKNLLVCAPTASGKTLIAELAFINNFLMRRGKALYIVPLKALANEKYKEFLSKYKDLGIKIGISTGDFDSLSQHLANKDLVILTSEKLDSLIRHKASWIKEASLLIIDEIHLINDLSRGATLEMVITLMNLLSKNLQFLGLSATIGNPEELASWLNAELILSDFRPIELRKGVFFYDRIFFEDGEIEIVGKGLESLVLDTINKQKQLLIFVNSRKSAESLAEKIASLLREENPKLAEKILVLDRPTKQCKKLWEVMRKGVAFHHAGLLPKQREIIEEEFKNGEIKVICATPTLAMGVNLPAFRVVIRDYKRYEEFLGYADYISNLEIHQMLGRAGRPKYDAYGEGIIMAKNEGEKEEVIKRYFLSPLEEIDSKLAIEPILRIYVLALISTEIAGSEEELFKIFQKTFFGFRYKDWEKLKESVSFILSDLADFGFVRKEGNLLSPTRIGKRVSELYIDPISAKNLIDGILKVREKSPDTFGYITLISKCYELYPLPSVKGKEATELEFLIAKKKDSFLFPIPDIWDYDYDLFLRSVKLARIFWDWINEKSEDEISERYNITPGELYQKITNASWLLYAMEELSKLLKNSLAYQNAKKLRIRIENGVKEELLELIRLPGIGRVKARRLYNLGFKSLSDILKGDKAILEKAIGKKTLEKLLNAAKS